MKNLSIKCHAPGATYPTPHFFVLNKGENSGKPLHEPCPNCFVVHADDAFTKDFLFWLSWGMWQSKLFHPYLYGSVIPYIRITDFKKLLSYEYSLSITRVEEVTMALNTMRDLSNKEIAIKKQLRLMNNIKQVIYLQKIRSTVS